MAKKNQEAAPPAISTIPLPDQDSPLVIDLPDGQKLVVGNIAHGTVIEVATWRGTGRPDSRTSRLMLGVSSSATTQSENSTTQSASSAEPAAVKKNQFKDFFQSLFAKTPKARTKKAVKERPLKRGIARAAAFPRAPIRTTRRHRPRSSPTRPTSHT